MYYNINLPLSDCKVPAAVTAAPSTPFNLNCPVEITSKQQGPQNISWAMLIGGKPVPITSKGVVVNETALAFQSVNYSDSQWYRCEYMLRQTRRCFDIKLLVQGKILNYLVNLTANDNMHNSYVTFLFPVRSGRCCCDHNCSRYSKNTVHLN